MQRYPDLLNNPNNDPRITQQQYEDWYREQQELDEINVINQEIVDKINNMER